MANLSKLGREKILAVINSLREQHKTANQVLIALSQIENGIGSKKYGLRKQYDE